MVDTTGISGPDDVDTRQAAAQLLEVDVDASEDEIQSAYQEAVLETHPDTGGSAEMFKAVDQAKDILDGVVEPSGSGTSSGPSRSSGPRGRQGGSPPGGAGGSAGTAAGSGTGFGGFGQNTRAGREGPDRDVVYNAMRNILRQNTDEETLKDKYGPNASMENVAEILTDLIMAGGMTLGDVKKMLDESSDFGTNFGEATGGLFGGPTGSGNIFGGGGGLGSTDPNDYMSYGSARSKARDDDEEES